MKSFKSFLQINLLENAISEEEKAKKRAEQVMHFGPKFLFSKTTGKSEHNFSHLPADEQSMWRSRYNTAREVFHDKDFMGTLPARPKERDAMLARKIGKHADIGLEDAMHAIRAHEMAVMMASHNSR